MSETPSNRPINAPDKFCMISMAPSSILSVARTSIRIEMTRFRRTLATSTGPLDRLLIRTTRNLLVVQLSVSLLRLAHHRHQQLRLESHQRPPLVKPPYLHRAHPSVGATQAGPPRLEAARQGLLQRLGGPPRLVLGLVHLRLGRRLVSEADRPGLESPVLSEEHHPSVLKAHRMHHHLARPPHRTRELRPLVKRLLLLVGRLLGRLPLPEEILRSGNHQRLAQAQLLGSHQALVLRHRVLQLSAAAHHLELKSPRPTQHLASRRSLANNPLPSDNRHNLLNSSLRLVNQHHLEVLEAPRRRLANQHSEARQHSAKHQRPTPNHPPSALQQPTAQREPSAAKHRQTTQRSAAQAPQLPANASQPSKGNG